MFLCREKELEELNYRYDNDRFECMIVYGRRRVGKTALINQFCKDKKTIYFPALKDTIKGNLEALSAAIYEYKNPGITGGPIYSSFQSALEDIGILAEKERMVFVIDEYPYLAKSDDSISSRLQHLIDLKWKKGKMFLILCGSSVSFMEDEVLAYESPLYGRRTGQIHLQPLDYRETAAFNPDLDYITNAMIYGITGGIPLYIQQLDVKKDLRSALLRNLFNPASYLFEEPENLLKQELREPGKYNAIIKAIAEGETKLGNISSKTGIETASCTAYIKTLMDLGIIRKETPFGQKEGRNSIYIISDPYFRFWYRFVPRNMGSIMTGRIEHTYQKSVEDYLHAFMGPIFEKICGQYLMKYDSSLPINLNIVGRWWGTDPKRKKAIEIDLIGEPVKANASCKEEYIVASCKFRNRETSLKDLEDLKEYSEVFSSEAEFYYYMFSISGFKEELNDLKETRVKLISVDQLYE